MSEPTCKKDWAHWARLKGFYVFPLRPETKKPPKDMEFKELSTRDPRQIESWWSENPDYNIGIYTGKFGDSEALIAVDVDVKEGVNGFDSFTKLELEGVVDSATFSQITPSGGAHFVYRSAVGVRQSDRKFGDGINIRSLGGYIVGPGSTLSGKAYTPRDRDLLYARQGLLEKCARSLEHEPAQSQDPTPEIKVDTDKAFERATAWFSLYAPTEVRVGSRHQISYELAARLKDFGITESQCVDLVTDWNNQYCTPPLDLHECVRQVECAYRYGLNYPGVKAPEKMFPPLKLVEGAPETPPGPSKSELDMKIEGINEEYAYIMDGSHIVRQTTDHEGLRVIKRLSIQEFHSNLAPIKVKIQEGDKAAKLASVSRVWMESTSRRQYEGLVFKPGVELAPQWYNLWRGFTVEPKEGEHYALSMFLEHAKENVCGGDESLFRWLIGYFAHLIQKPYEKPRTGLVFQGLKGVGKNALADRVGALIDQHYVVTSQKEDLTGRFNASMENCLMLVLNEVTWGGEKEADAMLKNLVDGARKHRIEYKGVNVFYVPNIARPIIVGNEPWLVSASEDERRYAVFKVGNGRIGDTEFFEKMRIGMEQGGYSHLLHYLLTFDISNLNVNVAPKTDALKEQKRYSLPPLNQWWFDCLMDGTILGGDFEGGWPREIQCQRFRDSFHSYKNTQRINGRFSNETIGKWLEKSIPSSKRVRVRQGEGERSYYYTLPTIEEARAMWEAQMGHKEDWPDD